MVLHVCVGSWRWVWSAMSALSRLLMTCSVLIAVRSVLMLDLLSLSLLLLSLSLSLSLSVSVSSSLLLLEFVFCIWISCDLFIWERFFFCLPMAAFPNADDANRRVVREVPLVCVLIVVLSATVFLLMVLLFQLPPPVCWIYEFACKAAVDVNCNKATSANCRTFILMNCIWTCSWMRWLNGMKIIAQYERTPKMHNSTLNIVWLLSLISLFFCSLALAVARDPFSISWVNITVTSDCYINITVHTVRLQPAFETLKLASDRLRCCAK